jgi:hypothetical protein
MVVMDHANMVSNNMRKTIAVFLIKKTNPIIQIFTWLAGQIFTWFDSPLPRRSNSFEIPMAMMSNDMRHAITGEPNLPQNVVSLLVLQEFALFQNFLLLFFFCLCVFIGFVSVYRWTIY